MKQKLQGTARVINDTGPVRGATQRGYCSRCARTVTDFADASHAESAKSHYRYVILRNFQF